MMTRLTNRITSASQGAIECTLHPSASIVPQSEELEGVDTGLLDYAYTGPAYWTDRWPAANLLTIVIGGLTGMEYQFWMIQGGGLDLVHKLAKDVNVHFVTFMPTPPECFLHSTKALVTVDDIKGLKIRTAGDDAEIFTRMGASTIFLPGGEVYEAIQRGVIDATQLSTVAVDYSLGTHEVSKYTYLSPARQPTDAGPIMVNGDSWAELPDNLKEVVTSVCESESLRYYAELADLDEEALQFFIDYGVEVGPPSQVIVDEMVRQAGIYYEEKKAEDAMYKEILESMLAYKAKIRSLYPEGL
jgi:TRAP-type mannitol/chloroaromatic compound transport system substrate-binding protein